MADDKVGLSVGLSALAFSQFASMAAAASIATLQRHGLIEQNEVDSILENLRICREGLEDLPGVMKHADLLEMVLRTFSTESTKQN